MSRTPEVQMLPEAVKAWRGERKMSQKDLANAADVSLGLIGLIEVGERQPRLMNAINIARALGVPLKAIALVRADVPDLEAAAVAS